MPVPARGGSSAAPLDLQTLFDVVQTIPKTEHLLHFDGADESLVITNSALLNSWPWSPGRFRPVGDAKIDDAQSKFGGTSLSLSGTGYVETDASPLFANFQLDFTVEFWFYPTAGGRQGLWAFQNDTRMTLDYNAAGTGCIDLFLSSNGTSWDIAIGNEGLGNIGAGAIPLNANAWNHIALVHNGTSWKVFVNGVQDISFVSTAIITPLVSRDNMYLGRYGGTAAISKAIGWIDEYRTKWEAVYTVGFVPPVVAFSYP